MNLLQKLETRKETIGHRRHDLFFNNWIRDNLPDSRKDGFRCYDIDFILWNKTKQKLMLIELKSNSSNLKPDHKLCFSLINMIGNI